MGHQDELQPASLFWSSQALNVRAWTRCLTPLWTGKGADMNCARYCFDWVGPAAWTEADRADGSSGAKDNLGDAHEDLQLIQQQLLCHPDKG